MSVNDTVDTAPFIPRAIRADLKSTLSGVQLRTKKKKNNKTIPDEMENDDQRTNMFLHKALGLRTAVLNERRQSMLSKSASTSTSIMSDVFASEQEKKLAAAIEQQKKELYEVIKRMKDDPFYPSTHPFEMIPVVRRVAEEGGVVMTPEPYAEADALAFLEAYLSCVESFCKHTTEILKRLDAYHRCKKFVIADWVRDFACSFMNIYSDDEVLKKVKEETSALDAYYKGSSELQSETKERAKRRALQMAAEEAELGLKEEDKELLKKMAAELDTSPLMLDDVGCPVRQFSLFQGLSMLLVYLIGTRGIYKTRSVLMRSGAMPAMMQLIATWNSTMTAAALKRSKLAMDLMVARFRKLKGREESKEERADMIKKCLPHVLMRDTLQSKGSWIHLMGKVVATTLFAFYLKSGPSSSSSSSSGSATDSPLRNQSTLSSSSSSSLSAQQSEALPVDENPAFLEQSITQLMLMARDSIPNIASVSSEELCRGVGTLLLRLFKIVAVNRNKGISDVVALSRENGGKITASGFGAKYPSEHPPLNKRADAIYELVRDVYMSEANIKVRNTRVFLPYLLACHSVCCACLGNWCEVAAKEIEPLVNRGMFEPNGSEDRQTQCRREQGVLGMMFKATQGVTINMFSTVNKATVLYDLVKTAIEMQNTDLIHVVGTVIHTYYKTYVDMNGDRVESLTSLLTARDLYTMEQLLKHVSDTIATYCVYFYQILAHWLKKLAEKSKIDLTTNPWEGKTSGYVSSEIKSSFDWWSAGSEESKKIEATKADEMYRQMATGIQEIVSTAASKLAFVETAIKESDLKPEQRTVLKKDPTVCDAAELLCTFDIAYHAVRHGFSMRDACLNKVTDLLYCVIATLPLEPAVKLIETSVSQYSLLGLIIDLITSTRTEYYGMRLLYVFLSRVTSLSRHVHSKTILHIEERLQDHDVVSIIRSYAQSEYQTDLSKLANAIIEKFSKYISPSGPLFREEEDDQSMPPHHQQQQQQQQQRVAPHQGMLFAPISSTPTSFSNSSSSSSNPFAPFNVPQRVPSSSSSSLSASLSIHDPNFPMFASAFKR